MVKKRVSKFELLRIIAMFLIVLHHSIIHGVLGISSQVQLNNPVNTNIAYVLEIGGKIGVIMFVLITGYFMCLSHISLEKLVKLWLSIWFWSILFCLIFSISLHTFSLKLIIENFFPIIFDQYWFMTVYFLMYCLIPLLNIIVKYIIDNKDKLYYFILMIVLIISQNKYFFGPNGLTGSSLITFCCMYCVGGIIREKGLLNNRKFVRDIKNISIITFLVHIILITFLIFLAVKLQKTQFLNVAGKLSISISLLFIEVEALGIFTWIGSIEKIRYNQFINQVASVTFGIYLISDNNYVRPWIWHTIFHMNDFISKSPLLIIGYTLLVSVIVFIVSALLECCRKLIFSKFEDKLANKIKSIINI